MAKKQPSFVYNDFKTDADYGDMFSQHMNNSGFANDYNAYQAGQQAFQQSQAEAQRNGLSAEGNDTVGNGILGSLIDSAQAGAAGSFGGTARFLGEFSPIGKDAFNSFADSMDEIVRNNTPLEKPEGANYIAGAIGNAIGSGGAAMAEAAIVAGIGSALGIGAGAAAGAAGVGGLVGRAYAMKGSLAAGRALGRVTLRTIEQTPALGHLAKAAEKMWSSGFGTKIMLGEVLGSPFEASAEAGNLITEMRQEGYSDDEIRTAALKSAAYNTAWLTVANVLESKVGMAVNGATKIGSKAGKVAMASLGDAAGEGMEEFGQNLIGNVAKGEDLDFEEAREAALQGAIGGAFLGGGRQAIDSYLVNNNQQEATPEAREDVAADRLRQGLNQEAQPIEQEQQPVANTETPVEGQPVAEGNEDIVPTLEVVEKEPQQTTTVEEQLATPQQEEAVQETPVEQGQEEQGKPVQPKPEKAPIVGSATAYKEKGHKWKTVAQAQADLDAIVADVKVNGGKYNLNDFLPSIKAKISADLALGKGAKSQDTLKQMWKKFYSEARAAKQEWRGNKKSGTKVAPKPATQTVVNKPAQTVNTQPQQEVKPIVAEQPTDGNTQNIEEVKPTQVQPVTETPQQNLSNGNKTGEVEAPESNIQEETTGEKTPLGFNSKIGEWETNTSATKDGSGEHENKAKGAEGSTHYYKRADGSVGTISNNSLKGTYTVTVNGKQTEVKTLTEAEQLFANEPRKQPATKTVNKPKSKPAQEDDKTKRKHNFPEKIGFQDYQRPENDAYSKEWLSDEGLTLDDIAWYGDHEIYAYPNGNVRAVKVDVDTGAQLASKDFNSIEDAVKAIDNGEVDEASEESPKPEPKPEPKPSVKEAEPKPSKPSKEQKPPKPSKESKPQKGTKTKPEVKPEQKPNGISEKQRKIVEALGSLAKKCGVNIHFGDQELIDHLMTRNDIESAVPFPEELLSEHPEGAGTILVTYKNGTQTIMEGLTNPKTNDVWIPSSKMSVDSTVHEFTHLWNKVIQANNPELWQKIVNVLQKTSKWKEIAEAPEYQAQHKGETNAIADEVMAWLAGGNANKRFKELKDAGTPVQVINKLKSALKAYWKKVKGLFHELLGVDENLELDDLLNMPLADLLENRINFSEHEHSENVHVKELIGNTDEQFNNEKGERPIKTIIKALRQEIKPQFEKAYNELTDIISKYEAQGKELDVEKANEEIKTKIDDIFKKKPFNNLLSAEDKFREHFHHELAKIADKARKAKAKEIEEARKAEVKAKKQAEVEVKAKAQKQGISEKLQNYIDEEFFGDSDSEDVQFLKSPSGITGIEGLQDNASWADVIEWAASKAEKQDYQNALDKLGEAIKERVEEESDSFFALDNYYEHLTGEEGGLPYGDVIEEEKAEKKTNYIPLGENDAVDNAMHSIAKDIKAGKDVDEKIEEVRNKLQDRENNPYKLSSEDAKSALEQFDGIVANAKEKLAETKAKAEAEAKAKEEAEAKAKAEAEKMSNENKTEETKVEPKTETNNLGPLSELIDPIEIADTIMDAEEGEINADNIRSAVANMTEDDRITFFESLKGSLIENNIDNLDIENGKTADPDYPLKEQFNDMLSAIQEQIQELNIPEEYAEWLTDITSRSPIWQNLKDNEGYSFDKDVVEFNRKKYGELIADKLDAKISLESIVESIINDDGKYNTASKIEDAVAGMSKGERGDFLTLLKHALIKDNLGVFNRHTSLDEQLEYLSQTIEDFCEGHEIPFKYEDYFTDIDNSIKKNLKKNKYKSIDLKEVKLAQKDYGYLLEKAKERLLESKTSEVYNEEKAKGGNDKNEEYNLRPSNKGTSRGQGTTEGMGKSNGKNTQTDNLSDERTTRGTNLQQAEGTDDRLDSEARRGNIKAQATTPKQQVMLQGRNGVQRKSVLSPENETKYVDKVKELTNAVNVQKYDDGIFIYTLKNGDNVLLDLTTDSASVVNSLSDTEKVQLAKAAAQGELVGVNGFNANESRTEFGGKVVRTIHLTDLVNDTTPTHEVMHFAYDLYATTEEKAVLLRDAIKQLKRQMQQGYGPSWESEYNRLTAQEKRSRCEEIIADGLVEHLANEKEGSALKQIARKIIRALTRWANELGVHSKMGIYESVKQGNFFAREHPSSHQFVNNAQKKGQIVGTRENENIDDGLLDVAKYLLEEKGYDVGDVFVATGFYKDVDGNWKTIVNDDIELVNISLIPSSIKERTTLGKIYKNEELYKAYPFLENIEVKYSPLASAHGASDYNFNIIELNAYEQRPNRDVAKTILHEVQHFIQEHEGFANGGAENEVINDINERISTINKFLNEVHSLNEAEEWIGDAVLEAQQRLRKSKTDSGKRYYRTFVKNLLTRQEEYGKYNNFDELVDDLTKEKESLTNSLKVAFNDAFDAYFLLRGEQESRNTVDIANDSIHFYSNEEIGQKVKNLVKKELSKAKLSPDVSEAVEMDIDDRLFSLQRSSITKQTGEHLLSNISFKDFQAVIRIYKLANEKINEMVKSNSKIWNMIKKDSEKAILLGGNNNPILTNDYQKNSTKSGIKLQATASNVSTESKLAGAVTTNTPKTIGEKVTSFKNNPSAWISEQWKNFYINWVDKNDIFKDIDKKTEEVIGRKLKQHEKLYGRAQGVMSSANGTADVLIGGGREELVGLNQRLQNTKLKHPNGTMKQVLENVKEDVLDNASKEFMKKYGFKDAIEALGSALTWRRLREMHRLTDEAHKQWQHQKDLMDKWQAKKDKYDKLREDAFRAIEDGKSVKIGGKVYTSKSAVGKALVVGPSPLAQHHTDWVNASREWNSAHEKWRKAKKQAERHNQPFNTVDPSIAMKEAWKAKCKQEQWDVTTAEPSTKLADEPKYELPNNLTIQELEQGIKTIPKQFLKACDDYYDMNDNILCLLEDSGVISKELHNLLNTTYKEYCPLQRDFSDTQGLEEYLNGFSGGSGVANVSNMIKEISKDGSKKNIINPLETTISASMVAARRAERNRVGQKLVELADVPGMETVVKRVDPVGYEKDGSPKYPAADPKYSTFTVMEDGKKVTYQTSPEYYQAIVGYDAPTSNVVWDSLAVFAQFLRTGATMTPSFIVRNGFRDSVLAGYMTNVGFKPIIGTINGIRKLHAKSGKEAERNAMFKAMGFGSMTRERDGEAIYNDLQKQVGSDKIDFTNPFSLWRAFKDWFVGLNEDVELGTRRELFGLAMDKYEADFKAGKITFEDVLQLAAETGRFGTTDFTRSGIKGQQVNRVSAFFNANVQGVDLYFTGLKNPETRPRMLAFIGTYIAMPCLAIWAANHDKDWWKELDPQVKYTNFCVSEYFRVPLPQEAGVMFGGGLMAILDMALDNDPKAMGVWGHAVRESLCPNPIPTVLTPIMEWQANYSFFKGRPIVNQRLQKLPDDMQYDNYTTELSKLIGKVANLSPKKIDNTVKDIGATLGIQGWDVLGDALVMAVGQDKVRSDKNFREKVFVRDFNVTEGIRGRYTNDFYDLWSEANKLKSGGRINRQQEKAIKSLNAAQRVISKLNKEIRAIGDPENTRLTSEQKQEMLAVRREKIKKVAKQATDKYGKYFA